MRDQVELIDSQIRIRASGFAQIVADLSAEFLRPFDDIEDALGADDYVVTGYDEDDIVAIERDSFEESLVSEPIWKAIAPFVDAGDHLVYRETYDGRTYKVLFDGKGGFARLSGRVVFG